jgi:hypothetical protein
MYVAYNLALRRDHVIILSVEKKNSVTQPVCAFVAVGIQHARLSFVASPDRQTLYTLSHKPHDFHNFRKKVIEHKMCLEFLYKFV